MWERGVEFGGGELTPWLRTFAKYFADRQDLSSSFQNGKLDTHSKNIYLYLPSSPTSVHLNAQRRYFIFWLQEPITEKGSVVYMYTEQPMNLVA